MAARFGDMLLEQRRRMGLSIQQVANTIKIRPQIIEFFETGNFASMPPRGYAQGMISSYARFLGLNPREVVNAYFDDLMAYERETSQQGGRFQDAAGYVNSRSSVDNGRFLMVQGGRSTRYGQRPQIGERRHEAGTRGDGRRKGKVGIDGRRFGRGARGLFRLRRKRADRRAQTFDGLGAAGIQIRQSRSNSVFAHTGVTIGGGAIAVVVDHLVLVHVERHVRLVQVAARTTHRALNRHVFGEARAAVLNRQHSAVEHERTPLHKGAAQRRLFPERLHKRPLRHHFLQSHPG